MMILVFAVDLFRPHRYLASSLHVPCVGFWFLSILFCGNIYRNVFTQFLYTMKYKDQGGQQLWQPLYYLTPLPCPLILFSILTLSTPSCFPFFPSLPERRHMQSQVNTLICGRNLSHPLLSFSPHSLCRSSWLTPLCFKSWMPAHLLYLEPSSVCLTVYAVKRPTDEHWTERISLGSNTFCVMILWTWLYTYNAICYSRRSCYS